MENAMLASGRKRRANTIMVEYIRNRQTVHRDVSKRTRNIVTEEVGENIEYLDEVAGDEYVPMLTSTLNECIEPDEEEGVNTFYPNAIQCLIALYGASRQKTRVNGERTNWEDIARQMRDSYFEFDCGQVRRKFEQLRRLYYAAAAAGSGCDGFDYFDQMDQLEQAKLLEDHSQNLQFLTTVYTADEESYLTQHHVEAVKPEAKQTHADEAPFEQCPERADDDTIDIKIEQQKMSSIQSSSTMNRKKNKASINPPPVEHEPAALKRISLAEYDAHQERRHQEKIALIRSGIEQQERNMAMQRQLMEEIIKRL